MMDFVFKMMNYMLTLMDFVFKMMNFVGGDEGGDFVLFKMMNFVLK